MPSEFLLCLCFLELNGNLCPVQHEQEVEDPCESANVKSPTSKTFGTKAVGNSGPSNRTSNLTHDVLQNTKELNQKLKKFIRDRSDLLKTGSFSMDKVKLGAIGWKERYYKEKLCAETKADIETTRKAM
ncbi:hypothetical protein U1Q18_032576, partial [Sarracenia purpurea var. burkii]